MKNLFLFFMALFTTVYAYADNFTKPDDFEPLAPKDGVISIGTAEDLYKLAAMIRYDLVTSETKVELSADIDYTAYTSFDLATLGADETHPFIGSFDGKEHKITIKLEGEDGVEKHDVGLFSWTRNATIKNLVVDGSFTMKNGNRIGGIVGRLNGDNGLISNCVCLVKITDEQSSGDGTIGGVVSCQGDKAKVQYCAFYGEVNAPYRNSNGGIVGWTNGKSSNIIGCIAGGKYNWNTYSGNDFGRNYPTVTNCKKVANYDTSLASGKLCYEMNGDQKSLVWYQNVGTDQYPMPFSSHKAVSKGYKGCELSYANDGLTEKPVHNFVEGVCSACHHGEYIEPTDGVYVIKTAKDLFSIATLAYDDMLTVDTKIELDNDIDYSAYTDIVSATIGSSEEHPFRGTFDGKEHKITINFKDVDRSEIGLFSWTNKAIIKNLVVDGTFTIKKEGASMGSIVGVLAGNGSQLANCVSYVDITDNNESTECTNGYIGGLCAWLKNYAKIVNCAYYGTVKAPMRKSNAGIAALGDNTCSVTNCISAGNYNWNATGSADIAPSATVVNCKKVDNNDASLASGKLCYEMNGDQKSLVWYQNVGTDQYPMPFSSHNAVLRGYKGCELSYANNGLTEKPAHNFVEGVCSVCHRGEHIEPTDGVYVVKTAKDLFAIATMVHDEVLNADSKIELANDIDYSAYTDVELATIGFSTEHPFRGTFDGKEHKITINFKNVERSDIGLFSWVNNGTIKNLAVAGSLSMKSGDRIGSIVGELNGNNALLTNCVSYVTITDPNGGDGTIGGLCGTMRNKAKITNCAFYGKIDASRRYNNGGIAGWCDGKSCSMTNSIAAGIYIWFGDNNKDFARNNVTATNCQKVANDASSLASGQLCYEMNGDQKNIVWYQTLNTDSYPVPFATTHNTVYYGYHSSCVKSYSNDKEETAKTEHSFVEGLCEHCGAYQIKDAAGLNAWAAKVNGGAVSTDAFLVADIDMSSTVYTPAGTKTNVFCGTFDGQGHSVTLNISTTSENQGLIGVAKDGAVIKNVIVKGSVKGGSYTAAVLGRADGTVTGQTLSIINCGNEADVEGGQNAAGIVAVNMNNSTNLYVENCYTIGTIKATKEGGAISGWTGKATVKNCYSTSVVTNNGSACNDFARNDQTTFTSCYALEGTANNLIGTNKATSFAAAQLADGTLCTNLGTAFYQIVGINTHPILNSDYAVSTSVVAAINKIGTVEYTTECKSAIDLARTAYDALTAGQKALITSAQYKVLTDAETQYANLKAAAEKVAADNAAASAVVTAINNIGTVEYTDASKKLIDDARSAYDALTADQKSLITEAQYKVLTDAETKYANLKAAAEKAAAEKAAADNAAASAVVTAINNIGTVEYTDASKKLIDDARTAYEALTADQKALITEAQYKVLTDAETKYADLAAVDEVLTNIYNIGTVVYTDKCKELIDDARDVYNYLTADQKALITEAQYKVLTDAETQYANLKAAAEKLAADNAKASAVVTAINNIGTVEYTAASKKLIDDARTAYEALTADQKAIITSAQYKVLTDAEAEYEKLSSKPTGLSDVNVYRSKAVKTIQNGQIVIIRDGIKYDLSGHKL